MRFKFTEVLKFVVAVAIGFTLRVMFENSAKLKTNNINDSPIDYQPEFNLDNIHEQLRQPHQPKSLNDLIEYRYFNLSMVFDTHLGQVETKMKSYHQSDIRDIIKQVETHINSDPHIKYRVKEFLNGFERIDPVRGKEYIMDLKLVADNRRNSGKFPDKIYHVSLVKPFGYAQIVSQSDVTSVSTSKLNLIYTLHEQQKMLLYQLLKNHEIEIIGNFPVNVTIVYCASKQKSADVQQLVSEFINTHKLQIAIYQLHFIPLENCSLTIPQMKRVAVRQFSNVESNLVLLDVNANISSLFLYRCHSFLFGRSDTAFIPIPFAEFKLQSPTVSRSLSVDTGLWDHENYEVLCIKRTTFDEAGGINENETSDQAHRSLLNKLISSKKEIFRSTDPSVRLTYHHLNCKAQEALRYSTLSYCENRQKRTLQSISRTITNIKL